MLQILPQKSTFLLKKVMIFSRKSFQIQSCSHPWCKNDVYEKLFIIIFELNKVDNLLYQMSDSESSEELEVKIELQHESKVRELIERAKQILPGYSVPLFSFRKNHSSISTRSHSRLNPSFLTKWTSLSNSNALPKKKDRLKMTGTIPEKENALLHKLEN